MNLRKVHKEGYKIIGGLLLFCIILNTTTFYFLGNNWIFYLIAGVSLVLFTLTLIFFRDLNRVYSGDTEGLIIAPADGKIVVVEEVTENDHFKDKRIQVSIFMSPFNAHVNWIPADGTVVANSHQNGRFRAAYLPKSSIENERSTIVIETTCGQEILVRQIAGAMAKRIVTYVKKGDACRINEELGFIKFGSRVDIFLPPNADIRVDLGQKVSGNHTVIAYLNK
ncbi:phosphatidylserine decarboxylase family protein [Bacteroidales bacterium OttesenSCG-928-M11]|nr:phosphatidylserine decarboxylase family protein [Bacteroidales bacterium OttesenSCG-928-M11]